MSLTSLSAATVHCHTYKTTTSYSERLTGLSISEQRSLDFISGNTQLRLRSRAQCMKE